MSQWKWIVLTCMYMYMPSCRQWQIQELTWFNDCLSISPCMPFHTFWLFLIMSILNHPLELKTLRWCTYSKQVHSVGYDMELYWPSLLWGQLEAYYMIESAHMPSIWEPSKLHLSSTSHCRHGGLVVYL